MKKPLLAAAASIFAATLVLSPMAEAVELKVIAGGSMTASLNALAPEFEKATGHKLVTHFDSTPNIITRVTSGTPFDVVVVPVDVFKDATAKARFAPGPIDIARVCYGVIVCTRAARPRHQPPRRAEEGPARRPIRYVPAGKCRRCLRLEDIRAARYRRSDESQNQSADRDDADSGSRRQWRGRTRGVSRKRADGARRRTRRFIPRRTAAGTGVHGRRRRRYKGSGCRQGLHQLSDHARGDHHHQ